MKLLKYGACLLVALILTISSGASLANASWEHDIAVADKLVDSGYYDAAIADYQKAVTTYSNQSPAEDKAWYGLTRAYHLSGNIPAAKLAAEKCLEINNDEVSASGARELYRTLQGEAHSRKLELEKAYNYYQYEYDKTSWLNIITKVLNYVDLRKVRKEFNVAEEYDKTFNPRYLIDPVVIDKPIEDLIITDPNDQAEEYTDTALNDIDTSTTIGADFNDTANDGSSTQVVIQQAAKDPNVVLKESREKYLEAYRVLQEALRGQNQQKVQLANDAFQSASKAYKEAQSMVASQ
jgi:tetratricopeptide (TPR) repeat protein